MSYAAHEPYCTTSDLSSAIDLIEHLPQYGVPPDVVAQLQAAVRELQEHTHALTLELRDEVAMREQISTSWSTR